MPDDESRFKHLPPAVLLSETVIAVPADPPFFGSDHGPVDVGDAGDGGD
jgi:hypothetical protein